MARSKEFDTERALAAAVNLFWRLGYENSSLDMLMHEMGISRQSLYDTFGDKRALYLKAMAFYRKQTNSSLRELLASCVNSKGGLHAGSSWNGRGIQGATCAWLPTAQREHGARGG